jgi:hypothetical protein
MKKLTIKYPVIEFTTLTVEVTDEKAHEVLNACNQDAANFIREMVAIHDPLNKGWLSNNLESALEMEYARITEIKPYGQQSNY